jgi:hypothetical protein
MGKCVVCGKEFSYSVGRVCLDCFQKVGSEVCCICGKKVDVNVAKEYWAYGMTERYGVVDAFHGLLCDGCASEMVQCKVCRCFVPLEGTVDYVEMGTGKVTGEKVCYECYGDEFYGECDICSGLIPKGLGNFRWDEEGRFVCRVCAEKLAKERSFCKLSEQGENREGGDGIDQEVLGLHSTDDARVWAESFVKKVKELYGVELDLEWVQGWFANAMCVAQDLVKRR